jgi:hypothetical protein
MILDKQLIGTQLPIPISIERTGFSMDTDTWSVRCMVGALSVRCPVVKKTDGTWVFLLDTSRLKAGLCIVIVEYQIPDENFTGGARRVVWKDELTYLEDV